MHRNFIGMREAYCEDIGAELKRSVSGDLAGYTAMMIDALNIVMERMMEMAKTLGRDAIISIRLQSVRLRPAQRREWFTALG